MYLRRLSLFILLALLALSFGVVAAQDTATPEPTTEATAEPTTEPTTEVTPEPTTETEAEPTTEVTDAVDAEDAEAPPVTRIRLVHLAPDAPALVPYVNGEPSGIQTVSYPSMTGWVEVLGDSFTLSLIPEGVPRSQAAIGPVTISNQGGGFTTVAVVGSFGEGTLSAYAIEGDVSRISENCARVTVFHAVEGAPAVDVALDGVAVANVGFPGGEAGTGQLFQPPTVGDDMDMTTESTDEAGETDESEATEDTDASGETDAADTGTMDAAAMDQAGDPLGLGNCVQVITPVDMDQGETMDADEADTTDESGESTETDTEASDDTSEATETDTAMAQVPETRAAYAGALNCRALPIAADMTTAEGTEGEGEAETEAATPEATTEGETGDDTDTETDTDTEAETDTTTETSQAQPLGRSAANCGFTVEVPSRSYALTVTPGSGGDALLSLQDVALAPNTYYFLAVIGTSENPQVFTFATSGSAVNSLNTDE